MTPTFAQAQDLAAVSRVYQFRLAYLFTHCTDREWSFIFGSAAEEASRLATAYAIFAALLAPRVS